MLLLPSEKRHEIHRQTNSIVATILYSCTLIDRSFGELKRVQTDRIDVSDVNPGMEVRPGILLPQIVGLQEKVQLLLRNNYIVQYELD